MIAIAYAVGAGIACLLVGFVAGYLACQRASRLDFPDET